MQKLFSVFNLSLFPKCIYDHNQTHTHHHLIKIKCYITFNREKEEKYALRQSIFHELPHTLFSDVFIWYFSEDGVTL